MNAEKPDGPSPVTPNTDRRSGLRGIGLGLSKNTGGRPWQPGFQAVRVVTLADPDKGQAFWLRFNLLASENGFRRAGEARAIVFTRRSSRETLKSGFKSAWDLKDVRVGDSADDPIKKLRIERMASTPAGVPRGLGAGWKFGDAEIALTGAKGSIQTKGRSLKWDLTFSPRREIGFSWVPSALERLGLTLVRAQTPLAATGADGIVELDGEGVAWNAATSTGSVYDCSGPSFARAWTRVHCARFVDESGHPTDAVFEGVTARDRLLGLLPSPQISTFFLAYRSRVLHWNGLWQALRSQSKPGLTEWAFSSEAGDFVIQGRASGEHRDFAGVAIEDTDGSLLQSAVTPFARLSISVYRRGKLEVTLRSDNGAAMEIVSPDANPYVVSVL